MIIIGIALILIETLSNVTSTKAVKAKAAATIIVAATKAAKTNCKWLQEFIAMQKT